MNPVLVKRFRGGEVESFHRGVVCIVDSAGKIVFSLGDVDQRAYARSALKLYQQLPLLESGAAARFSLTNEEIAVTCGSHNGEKRHVDAVRSILSKCGLSEAYLNVDLSILP
jgi:L-asparaginase II